MPLSPKRVAHRKVQRGREKGNATRDNNIDFGEIALVAMEPTWLSARVIEAARVAINRKLDRKGQVGFAFSLINLFQRNLPKFVWVRVKVLQNFGQLLSNLV